MVKLRKGADAARIYDDGGASNPRENKLGDVYITRSGG